MAEIFGAAASAIGVVGVAAQCIDGIKKLRDFQQDVKNAPEDIKYIADELEQLTSIIDDVKNQFLKSSQATSLNLTGTLRSCQDSANTTAKIISDLNAEIDRWKKIGSLKAAWKKKSLDNYITKTERAKSTLAFAYTAFKLKLRQRANPTSQEGYHELQQSNLSEVIRKIEQIPTVIETFSIVKSPSLQLQATSARFNSQDPAGGSDNTKDSMIEADRDDASTSMISRRMHAKFTTRSIARLHLRLPYWLVSRSVELDLRSSIKGWTINLNAQRTVPSDCEFFTACREGDLELMQDLFAQGKASVYDIDPYGKNALHHACKNLWPFGHYDASSLLQAISYLLEYGVDPNARNCYMDTPLSKILMHESNEAQLKSIVCKAFESRDEDNLCLYLSENSYYGFPSYSNLETLRSGTRWDDLDITTRVNSFYGKGHVLSPDAFETWIGRDWELIWRECSYEQAATMLATICLNLGRLAVNQSCTSGHSQGWLRLLTCALKEYNHDHGDIQLLSMQMLRCFILGCCIASQGKAHFAQGFLNSHFMALISVLQEHKVDLITLGHDVRRKGYPGLTSRNKINTRVISISFGEDPKDWLIFLSDPIADAEADLCGDFWNAIYHPETAIPGAWVEEDNDPYDPAFYLAGRASNATRAQRYSKFSISEGAWNKGICVDH